MCKAKERHKYTLEHTERENLYTVFTFYKLLSMLHLNPWPRFKTVHQDNMQRGTSMLKKKIVPTQTRAHAPTNQQTQCLQVGCGGNCWNLFRLEAIEKYKNLYLYLGRLAWNDGWLVAWLIAEHEKLRKSVYGRICNCIEWFLSCVSYNSAN